MVHGRTPAAVQAFPPGTYHIKHDTYMVAYCPTAPCPCACMPGGVLRVKGRNLEENEHVKLGAYHTLELEVQRAFTLTKVRAPALVVHNVSGAQGISAPEDVFQHPGHATHTGALSSPVLVLAACYAAEASHFPPACHMPGLQHATLVMMLFPSVVSLIRLAGMRWMWTESQPQPIPHSRLTWQPS